MAVEQSTKVTASHLMRKAYIYVRQSSPRQVVEHQESGRRQYELRQRAIGMGWPEEQVEVIDSDQAKSATRARERDGFENLVTEVSMDERESSWASRWRVWLETHRTGIG